MADTSPTGAVTTGGSDPDGNADGGRRRAGRDGPEAADADASGSSYADRIETLRLVVWAVFAAFVAVLVGGVVASPFLLGDATLATTDAQAFLALVGATVVGTVLLVAAQALLG
jgi:hypothetical protein